MLKRTGPPKRKTPMPRKAARTKKSTTAHRKQKRAERMEHNEETAEIRAAVFERAGGKCECDPGCRDRAEELDHWYGRVRVKQSVRNTWALSSRHHKEKTDNKPNALMWAILWLNHCLIEHYEEETAVAQARVDYLAARAALSYSVTP